MKVTQAQAEGFFANHEKADVKTFLQNYQAPVLRILADCLDKNDDVVKCLNQPSKVIASINNNKNFKSINTKKLYLQALLWFVDHYPGMKDNVPREDYFNAWNTSKVEASETMKEYDVPSPGVIQQAVDKKYGKDSIESLYISFYREVPMRLDYKDIKVYSNEKGIPEDQKKFVLYTGNKFVAKEYNKTSKKHGMAEYNLSPELIQKIKNSLKKQPRDQLFIFSNQEPSKAISNLLKGAGLNMSLNGLRHSVSMSAKTPEEKAQLAQKMKHSVNTAQKYRQQVKGDTVSIEVPKAMEEEVKKFILARMSLDDIDEE